MTAPPEGTLELGSETTALPPTASATVETRPRPAVSSSPFVVVSEYCQCSSDVEDDVETTTKMSATRVVSWPRELEVPVSTTGWATTGPPAPPRAASNSQVPFVEAS